MKLEEISGFVAEKVGSLTVEQAIRLARYLENPALVGAESAAEVQEMLKERGWREPEVKSVSAVRMATNQEILGSIAKLALQLGSLKGNRLRAIENAIVTEAIRRTAGNKSAAARALGVERKVVERKLAR